VANPPFPVTCRLGVDTDGKILLSDHAIALVVFSGWRPLAICKPGNYLASLRIDLGQNNVGENQNCAKRIFAALLR
jgi:hypothetical protein